MGRQKLFDKTEILAAIQDWIVRTGVPPTVAELKKALQVGSNRTVLRYLAWLEDEGYIQRFTGARGIKLRRGQGHGLETIPVPLVGTSPAGSVMVAEENREGVIYLPKEFLGASQSRFFLLRVRGSSMNRATVKGGHIEDGDLVLVKQQSTADTGDIVVALVDGEATIKRFTLGDGFVALRPDSTSRDHHPIVAGPGLRVQGTVQRVIKKGAELVVDLG